MNDSLFQQRVTQWLGEGDLTAFALACAAEAMDTVAALSDRNTGWEVVERRLGEYKSWDPDIIKVDKDTEDGYWRRLKARGTPVTFLSEEAGTVSINAGAGGEGLYAVCDPFDGSHLFKRGIPAFWYTSLALYRQDLTPACCAVGDCCGRTLAFADGRGAFLCRPDGAHLTRRVRLDKAYRHALGRPDVTELEGASIESYAMKPAKFLLPLVDKYRSFVAPFGFMNPNGGPGGFVDVAEGKIDCYFAPRQPFVDIFSGIQIAERAGAVVTDFEGHPVKFVADEETLWDVVATTNERLHGQVLAALAVCK